MCSYNLSMSVAASDDGAKAYVGVRELKNQLSRYLDQVKAGAEVTVTQHGRPIARLTPIDAQQSRRQELIDAGVIVPATRRRRLPDRKEQLTPGPSIAELIADERR